MTLFDSLKVKLRRLRLRRGALRVRRLMTQGDYDGVQAIVRASYHDEMAEREYLVKRILELGGAKCQRPRRKLSCATCACSLNN